MNGVTPAWYPVILIVVSSACVEPALGEKRIGKPARIAIETATVFINADFYGADFSEERAPIISEEIVICPEESINNARLVPISILTGSKFRRKKLFAGAQK